MSVADSRKDLTHAARPTTVPIVDRTTIAVLTCRTQRLPAGCDAVANRQPHLAASPCDFGCSGLHSTSHDSTGHDFAGLVSVGSAANDWELRNSGFERCEDHGRRTSSAASRADRGLFQIGMGSPH